MILVKPGFTIEEVMGDKPFNLIERAGRTCYKSESEYTFESSVEFVKIKMTNKLGHHSVLEHSAMTVRFIIDRGVSHELVRHRLCAFSQESTRYCNYMGGVTFIIPPCVYIEPGNYDDKTGQPVFDTTQSEIWFYHMLDCEINYIDLLKKGWSPQQARSVLPNSLKTEIVVTANFREWKHIFNLRCSKAAHPQMNEIMIPLRDECRNLIPVMFDDISTE